MLGLVDANDVQRVVEVGHGDLLDLENVVAVENGLEVFCREELRLELVKGVVVRVGLVELLSLDRLQHFEDRLFRLRWLLI